MQANVVSEYVRSEVQKLSDSRLRPLIQSVNSELAAIRAHEEAKNALDTKIAEANKRISELQKHIGIQQGLVLDLADKLAAATTVAVS
jgi:predicted transcriptional regulator